MKILPLVALLFSFELFAATHYYDDAGRLVQVAYATGEGIAYAYDDADNLVSENSISVPLAASNLSAERTSPTTAQISWTDNASTETAVLVQRRNALNNAWRTVATLPSDSTEYLDTTADPFSNYVYRIIAQGASGNSAFSNAATAAGAQSEPFTLKMLPLANDVFELQFEAVPDATYTLETSSNLGPASWTQTSFSTTPDGSAFETEISSANTTRIYFPVPPASEPRFYRLARNDE